MPRMIFFSTFFSPQKQEVFVVAICSSILRALLQVLRTNMLQSLRGYFFRWKSLLS